MKIKYASYSLRFDPRQEGIVELLKLALSAVNKLISTSGFGLTWETLEELTLVRTENKNTFTYLLAQRQ
jgi:hypothetical protein